MSRRGLAILLTGFTAGTLDIIAACLQYHLKTHKDVGNVLRYIASGVFGPRAFAGATTTMAAWGLFFHFVIAFGLTIFYFILYPRVPWLGKYKILAGILYGIFAWIVTTQLIVPLSAVRPGPFEIWGAIKAVLILVVCIGLPVSFMTNKHYLYKK